MFGAGGYDCVYGGKWHLPGGPVEQGHGFRKIADHDDFALADACAGFLAERHDEPFLMVASFDDGSYGIIDFKTSIVREVNVALYSRQLHAYAHALENAAPGKLSLGPVTRLGLYCLEPFEFSPSDGCDAVMNSRSAWIEIERDDDAFLDFMEAAVAVANSPRAPMPAPDCPVCNYTDIERPATVLR